jgi:pyruvate formate lyase activating enzyme
MLRICFEWNGCGNQQLIERAGELAFKSGGNLKFDLKCHDPTLSLALSGVDNSSAFANFEAIYERFYNERENPPVLTATTLMVSGYTDAQEVEQISSFIAEIDPSIPYSLLVFFPHHIMNDLPITPITQVKECYEAARKNLKRVNIGNLNLMSGSTTYTM